jgi:hypothetical protein
MLGHTCSVSVFESVQKFKQRVRVRVVLYRETEGKGEQEQERESERAMKRALASERQNRYFIDKIGFSNGGIYSGWLVTFSFEHFCNDV